VGKELSPCPECRFQNPVTNQRCMMCKAELRAKPKPRPARVAPPRGRRPRVKPAPTESQPLPALEGSTIWLYCPPLEPTALVEGSELLIGRKNSDLDLPHKQVSRKHLKIRCRGGLVEVEDLGSSNGTFLNETRLDGSSPFALGDRILVGPFELTLSGGSSELDETMDPSSTQAAAAWTGNLDATPLSEVLHDLEFNQHTGTLEVRSGRINARMQVFQGRPVKVRYDGKKLEGAEAGLAMLRLKGGRFLFQPSSRIKGSPLAFTLTSLLLDHAREVDEA
jgi:FHA domain-containing protein/uncharacterized protein DUF4388